jgi:signal transduction histidine kinase
VRQLADDYRAMVGLGSAGGKPVAISVAAGELRVDAPPALATIVISNLLRNAVENTDRGEVQIALEGRTLTITDTGRGISEQAQARLFTRGYSTKTRGGMGLHLTKRICDRLGWQLTIASSAGKGTVASVQF